MYSFSYLEPVCCSMSSSNCCFLTYIQISQEAGKVVCYPHIFKNFPQFVVIHTVKGFSIVNKAVVDVFLELSCFFDDPMDCWQFDLWFLWLLWIQLEHLEFHSSRAVSEKFEHYFVSVWGEYNCAVVWIFFGSAFLWDWNENWLFPVLWPPLSFPNLLA